MENINNILSAMASFVTEHTMLGQKTVSYGFSYNCGSRMIVTVDYNCKYGSYTVSHSKHGQGIVEFANTEEEAINHLNAFMEEKIKKELEWEFACQQSRMRALEEEMADLE